MERCHDAKFAEKKEFMCDRENGTYMHTYKTNMHDTQIYAYMQTYIYSYTRTNNYECTDRQTDRQTNRQTH